MFGSLFDRTVGSLGARALMTIVLPSLVFWVAIAAADGHQSVAIYRHWRTADSASRGLVVFGAVGGFLLASAILGLALPLFLDGYCGAWSTGGTPGFVARLSRNRQLRRWRNLNLADQRSYQIRFQRFPVREADLLPTRLGNVLRACVSYASDERRYGMDIIYFWPRLYPLLPDVLRSALTEARAAMDLALVTSILAWLFVPSVIALSALGGWIWPWGLVLAVAAGLLGCLAYSMLVNAAVTYTELVRSSVDVYRRLLLETMGFARPTTLAEERELWKAIGQLLYRRLAQNENLVVFPP